MKSRDTDSRKGLIGLYIIFYSVKRSVGALEKSIESDYCLWLLEMIKLKLRLTGKGKYDVDCSM